MEIYASFVLGLVGSLHCAGMCGPLVLALPRGGHKSLQFWAGRAAYNLGRVTAYALLGVVVGLAGRTVALAGFQRWLSLISGCLVLLALLPASRRRFAMPAISMIGWVKSAFSLLLRRRSTGASCLLGFLNGFLPCGLVYVACAGAIATGNLASGVLSMVAFGCGTIPMLLAIGFIGWNVRMSALVRFRRLIPISVALMGALLILRGLSLGIPYLSPDLASAGCSHCR